jgi:anti-sigma factor RsiW
MTQIERPEIEELLSSYIDGELSERQCNEVKRLLDHDPQVAEMLSHMQRQKELLNALEVETAPETMLDDIKATLERSMLLGQVGQEIREIAP